MLSLAPIRDTGRRGCKHITGAPLCCVATIPVGTLFLHHRCRFQRLSSIITTAMLIRTGHSSQKTNWCNLSSPRRRMYVFEQYQAQRCPANPSLPIVCVPQLSVRYLHRQHWRLALIPCPFQVLIASIQPPGLGRLVRLIHCGDALVPIPCHERVAHKIPIYRGLRFRDSLPWTSVLFHSTMYSVRSRPLYRRPGRSWSSVLLRKPCV